MIRLLSAFLLTALMIGIAGCGTSEIKDPKLPDNAPTFQKKIPAGGGGGGGANPGKPGQGSM